MRQALVRLIPKDPCGALFLDGLLELFAAEDYLVIAERRVHALAGLEACHTLPLARLAKIHGQSSVPLLGPFS